MQQRQRELLQALYVEHVNVLRLAAQRRGLPPEEADGAVQDTFCSFIESYLDEFTQWNERQIKSVLMRILLNRCADYYREKARHPDVSADELTGGGEYRILIELTTPDLESGIIVKDDLMRAREAIAALSPALRDAALLYLVERRSVREVCQILKIKEPACRMRLRRIRKYLSEWMKEDEG